MGLNDWFGYRVVKYNGLINRGQTCYLNSVLQVLFMTKEFRDAVNRFVKENPDTDFIDRHLKDLFDDLLKHEANTNKIMKTLDIDKVYEQQDAAEYFEKILRLTCPNTAKIFHGQMVHRTTCSVCGTKNDRDGPFWHLPLELVDSSSGNYSVEDGIKTYFSSTLFSGDNQMYCDTCDTKVDASSQYVIKHHPDVLILLLKRFDFSYEYMSYVKINRAVDVPRILTIPEEQVYELYAFVDHSGDLRGGHYIVTIKPEDEDDTWYSFDDTRVSQLDRNPFPDSVTVTRSNRAYLLFYSNKVTQEVCNPDQIPITENELKEKARDKKTMKRSGEGKEKSENADFSSLSINAEDANTGEQMESRNLSSGGHEKKVQDPQKSDHSEANKTTPDERQNKAENSQTSQNGMSKDKDTSDYKENKSLSPLVNHSEAKEPEDKVPTESEEKTSDAYQDFKSGDREMSGRPAGHERQGELSGAQGKTDETEQTEEKIKHETENPYRKTEGMTVMDEDPHNQEENQQLPSKRDLNTVSEPQNKEPTVKATKTNREQFVPPAGPDSQCGTIHLKRESTNKKSEGTQQAGKKIKHETGNSDSQAENVIPDTNLPSTEDPSNMKPGDVRPDAQEGNRYQPSSDKEISDGPAGRERHDEMSHFKTISANEKTEVIQPAEKKVKHETENSDRHTENRTMKDPDTDDHKEDRTLSSSDDQNEVKDAGKSDLPELDQVTPDMKRDNKPVDREMSPLPLQDELSDANSTADKDKQTDKDDYDHQSLGMTSQHQNTDELKYQNKATAPENEELVEVVEVIPDVTHGPKSIGSKKSAELAVCYQKGKRFEKQKSGNVTDKENKKSATRSKHKQDVEVMVGDQEKSRTLLSTETRLEVTDPENSGQPEVESTWERHKYHLFIGIGIVFFIVIIVILCILFGVY